MTADELIDSYVIDVVTLLPRSQRLDVAQELRALLHEEVDAATDEQGSRDEAARRLRAGFGRPADVAARYGTPVTLIEPADTGRAAALAFFTLGRRTGHPGRVAGTRPVATVDAARRHGQQPGRVRRAHLGDRGRSGVHRDPDRPGGEGRGRPDRARHTR